MASLNSSIGNGEYASIRVYPLSRAFRAAETRAVAVGNSENRPSVPTYVIQSHIVPAYMPQDDGRKSRLRLVTTMTYRSSHMPVFTTSEIRNSSGTFVRTRLNQSVCGITPLQKIRNQYAYQY